MDVLVTYQQDSTKLNSLIQKVPDNIGLKSVLEREKPVPIIAVPKREQQELPQKKTYTHAQIRNWRLQQENKLLVDSSKYISPRTDIDMSYAKAPDPDFILPIREHHEVGTDWLTGIFFLGIVLFATVRYAYSKYMEHLFLSLFNYSTSLRMFQERSYPVFHGAFRIEAIFYIIFSVFIFQALNILKWENAMLSPGYYLVIFGMVLLYYFGKKILYWIVGSMFETLPETHEYLFNIDNFNRSLGLILLPVVILVSFFPSRNPVFIVYSGITIIIILNLTLLLRGIFILLKKQFSIFYLFLYLCTLEFLPLLLIYKIVVE